MIDSKDKNSFSDAANMLYEVLNNVNAVYNKLPLLVACNKQDLTFAKRSLELETELASEIEQIRKVRRATTDTGDENTALGGYLENLKGKFVFSNLPIKVIFCECSLKTNDIDEIISFIEKYN